MRVLIVDDAAVSRAAFARMAAADGHVVVAEAETAERAFESIACDEPDVIVVDGRLPGGAPALISRVSERRPAIRIVVLAALGEREIVRAALEAGASAALLRPLVPSRVAAALGLA